MPPGTEPRDLQADQSVTPRRLSENLWVFEDTANVYVVRDGSSCVLIDFGSGAVLDCLPGLGITSVEWVLHTHHHRDQCQGDGRAVSAGIPIAVPAHERHLFEDAENFWRNRRIYHLYDVRNDFNTLASNIPVAAALRDYEQFRWRSIEFLILPSPGHTSGSISLVADIDERRVAFTGDLMYGPGKILTLYDTQLEYMGTEGIDLGAHSLARLAEQLPDLVCPSHGSPILDPVPAIQQTADKLTAYLRFMGGSPTADNLPYALSPHLVVSHQTCSTFYAIVSDSGRAMLIDYGAASSTAMWAFEQTTAPTGRVRFIEHSIDRLRADHGVTSIDVVMPSHMHDDHINGIPHLVRSHGTKVWSLDVMAPILEHPRGFNLGCILGEPISVDRRLRSGEMFRWEEFEFEIAHSPGHTEYQMALYASIDGQLVGFTGDALFPPDRTILSHRNTVYRNHIENDSHLRAIDGLIDHSPTLLCPGHERPFAVDRDLLTTTRENLLVQQQYFFDLLPEGGVDFGLDPSWVKIYPYQPVVAAGIDLSLEIRAQNYGPVPMVIEAVLVVPEGWSADPSPLHLEVPAKGSGLGALTVSIPGSWIPTSARFAITADVVVNGKHLGQIAEAVCEVAGSAPNLESWA